MRVSPFATVAVFTLASCCGAGCSPRPTRTPADRTIGIHLYRQTTPPQKCVVSFDDPRLKEPTNAVVYTGYKVIWAVVKNECGDLTRGNKKALGLKDLRFKGQTAKWIKNCTTLDAVPGQYSSPPSFRCDIPKAEQGDIVGLYEYEIDGDDVEPADPGLDVQKGH